MADDHGGPPPLPEDMTTIDTAQEVARADRILEEDLVSIADSPLPWESLSGGRIVVTGAGGFLGGYLVRTLLSLRRFGCVSRAVRVVALVRDVPRARLRYADLADAAELEILPWDLSAIAIPDLGECQYVLHAASQASPRFYGSDPVGTLLPNAVGTAALLEGLRRGGQAMGFLYVSSSEVYGAEPGEDALREDCFGVIDPATVRACYAESKRIGETICVAWHHQHQVPTFIVRPFHTYGPGLQPEDGRVFADFAYNVARGENIVMNSDGSARRAFCYVSDAIAGFFTVLLRGRAGIAYNVANPAGELSVAELAQLLVELFPDMGLRVERRHASSPPGYIPSSYSRLVPDVSRLEELGWGPSVPPTAGFRRFIEAIRT